MPCTSPSLDTDHALKAPEVHYLLSELGLRSMADHATTEDVENKLKEKLGATHLVRYLDSLGLFNTKKSSFLK